MTDKKPRHLNDETAFMPAIPSVPKHARPDTAELRAQRPPVPEAPRATGPTPKTPSPHLVTRKESRQANLPWWKRWLGLTK